MCRFKAEAKDMTSEWIIYQNNPKVECGFVKASKIITNHNCWNGI